MEPLVIDLEGLGSIKMDLENGLPKVEIQAIHIGDKGKHTSTTVLLSKEITEQMAVWLATALEIMEDTDG